jgi:hypothetical protein
MSVLHQRPPTASICQFVATCLSCSITLLKVSTTMIPLLVASAETTCNHPSIRPFAPQSQKASPNQDDKDEMESGEQICPISDDTVSCTITPLRPRKPRAKRLTDLPSELLETSLEACSATSTSDRVTKTPAMAAVNSKSTSLRSNGRIEIGC